MQKIYSWFLKEQGNSKVIISHTSQKAFLGNKVFKSSEIEK